MSVESNPEILGGKPILRGTRIPLELVLELAELGYSVDEIIAEYPQLTRQTLVEALKAAKRIHESVTYEKIRNIVEA